MANLGLYWEEAAINPAQLGPPPAQPPKNVSISSFPNWSKFIIIKIVQHGLILDTSILQQYVTSKHLKEAKMKGFEGHLTPPVSNSLLGHLSPNLFAVIASISFQQMATKWGNFP